MTSETPYPSPISASVSTSVPDPAALHMGRRLTRRRNDLHLSRRWLASLLGIPHQDFRAWEEGTSRIDAKTLHDLSVLLDVPMTYFVEGLEPPCRPKRLESRLIPRCGEFDSPHLGSGQVAAAPYGA
ncbi:helix-turn-helix domain-containing protein [Rhodospirillum sp. A1_3_36]|uniref:helix-turn-helix domain-containing protein n=1 Tax=Rhodospirillum sp. A1_3_36 TaxID=3391666 RepID=UPI0039A630D3